MAKLRIVLVEPREGGNVGAVARAMKNFGFSDLVLVGSVPPLHPVAEWWASGAEDVVAASGRAESLEAAISGSHLTIATSSGRGRVQRPLTTRQVRERWETLGADETLAIVFGRENSGLTLRELGACELTASIDTVEGFPVLNLAQSVAIFCYELSSPRTRASAADEARPTTDMTERLHARTRQLLSGIGFLQEDNPHRLYDELQSILSRAAINEREWRILMGIVRQLEWKLAVGGDDQADS